MKRITVQYKHFDSFWEFDNATIVKLGKLTLGYSGIMYEYIDAFQNGYVIDKWSMINGEWAPRRVFNTKAANRKYNICVAYVANKPIGWALTDENGFFNVYVHKTFRGHGIATKLAEVWAAYLRKRTWRKNEVIEWVHTDEAEFVLTRALLNLGRLKRKKRARKIAVTHKILN